MTILHSVNPASFWLGFSVAFIAMGVLAMVVAALCMRRGEASASIGAIRPRHWSETDEEPRLV